MRKTHKNDLFNFLNDSKYDMGNFILDEGKGQIGDITSIDFKNTPFRFHILPNFDDINYFQYSYNTYSPNFIFQQFKANYDISGVLKGINTWLSQHVDKYLEDQQVPDLWEEYLNNKSDYLINTDLTIDNSNFNEHEKIAIKFALNDLKSLIASKFEVNELQQLQINARLDYLASSLEKLSKTDWKGILISNVFTIIVALSLDTARGNELFNLFKKIFSLIPRLN